MKSFRLGGIHPHDNKLSADKAIEQFPLVESVVIPLNQHIGSPSVATVAKGDLVLVGDIVGSASGFVSSNIHSSVSGVVRMVGMVADGAGVDRMSVVVDVQGDQWSPSVDLRDDVVYQCDMAPKDIIARIAQMGIVGMGGATFPTHIKLTPPPGKKAKMLIVNGVECEPYLTSDHRVMLERGPEILIGCGIVMRALGVERCVIGVENNKKDAIAHLRELLESGRFASGIEVVPLKMRYPQGGEKQLVAAVMGVEIPSGQLPIEVGAVVQNISTVYAIYQAVQKNRPLVDRVVTVTGKEVKEPKNLQVRIGTPLLALLEYCSPGIMEDSGAELIKIVNGGPMMGRAVSNNQSVVSKGSSGVLVLKGKRSVRRTEAPCISCAKCVVACPMGLEPYLLAKTAKYGFYDRLEVERVTDCIECGCCSYTCPSNLPLLDYIRLGKAETMKIIRSRK